MLEDGEPQAIDRVSFVQIPIERGLARRPEVPAAAADVRTNQQRFDGRLYVLLLDDLHTSPSRTERVRAAASRFIEENLGPSDLAAVVHLSGPPGASQGFTSDTQRLLASVNKFSGRQLRSETLNLIDRYNEELQLRSGAQRGGGQPDPEQIRDPDEPLRAQDARIAFDSITDIARQVEPVRGRRKSLIWFGEGISYDLFDAKGRRQTSMVLESERRAVAAAARANLVIYGVDARGLEDSAYRSLEVRVSRPGASVRARRGYTRSRGAADALGLGMAEVPAALREVLAGPVSRPGLAMAVHTAAFRGKGDKASVL